MNRLSVRLVLAFALVIAVTAGVVAVLADQRAADAFRWYSSYTGAQPTELIDTLVVYWEAHGTWEGIEASLHTWERTDFRHMPMMRFRPGFSFPEAISPVIVLTDAKGQVLYDGSGHRQRRALTLDEQSAAQAIAVDGRVVGSLVVALPMSTAVPGPLEQRFLDRMRNVLVTASLLAGGFGLLLAFRMSQSLSAPLQKLASAARTVAAGDLSRRVDVSGSAEVAAVSTAFNEMAADLQEAETLRQNLMADVAHELRTPLTVLRGNLQAMLEGIYPADPREIQVLHDETQLLSRLVDDVRELALADAGRLSMDLRRTQLADVLLAARSSLLPAAEARGIALAAQIPQDLPSVWADPDRVTQVLHNLLANALRYTPEGGLVTISAWRAENGVQLVVRDSGEGIPAEHLDRIFDRFWRADPARARDERAKGSTGLGLSIARSLVEAQGGRIWAESEPGHGSAFHFTLPLAGDTS